ncbi:MAG: MFS transporter [Candidatus Muiribacteriaceae bacterium]
MINKWSVLIAGVFLQTILGGIYAWSTFVPFLIKEYGLSTGQTGFIFGLTIAVFTIAMIQAGRFMARKGPRLTAFIGACLFATGYVLSSFSNGNFALLLISIGFITGSGIGFGYVCPLSVGMKWFPERKGLVTGVAVAGFGGGAIILSSAGEYLIMNGMDVLLFFRYLGIVAGALMMIMSFFITDPEGYENAAGSEKRQSGIRSRQFAILAFGLFAGTFSGLMIIGNLKPIMLKAGLSEVFATSTISLFAVGNALGRVTWGHLFDRLYYKSITASLSVLFVALPFLLFPIGQLGFQIISVILGLGFGACFVVYASSVSKFFGMNRFASIYPMVFLGYGFAGLTGPGIGGGIADCYGSYDPAVYLSMGIIATAIVFFAVSEKSLR